MNLEGDKNWFNMMDDEMEGKSLYSNLIQRNVTTVHMKILHACTQTEKGTNQCSGHF